MVPADSATVQRVDPEVEPVLIRDAPKDVVVNGSREIGIRQVGRVGGPRLWLIDEKARRLLKRHTVRKGGAPEGQTHRVGRAVEIGDVEFDKGL